MSINNDEVELSLLQQQAIEWLIRLRTRELSEPETLEFAAWLSQDMSHAVAFGDAEDLFNVMTQAVQLKTNDVNLHSKIEQEATETFTVPLPVKHSSRRWLLVPLVLAAVWLIMVKMVLPEQASIWDAYLSDYHTGTGEQRTIQLTDGSQLLLNTDTAVSVDYQDHLRQIILLHGQAQFTVTDNKARPFTVSVGKLQVQALGTVFAIYQKESGDIDVTVQEHSVVVRLSAGEDHLQKQLLPILVQQGQELHYDHASEALTTPKISDSEFSNAWQQRRIIIRDRPLSELVAEIERYRPGRIFLGSDSLGNLHVTGLFSLTDPNASLDSVRKILGLKQTSLGPWWVLLHR